MNFEGGCRMYLPRTTIPALIRVNPQTRNQHSMDPNPPMPYNPLKPDQASQKSIKRKTEKCRGYRLERMMMDGCMMNA